MKEMSRRQYRGPSPRNQPTVALALDEMIKSTVNWLRRYEESWFDLTDAPATDLGFNPAGDLNAIPGQCDYAIEAVAQMAEFATEAQSMRTEVKKKAERRIEQRKSRAGESPHQNGEKI